jgi:hypothetical protein
MEQLLQVERTGRLLRRCVILKEHGCDLTGSYPRRSLILRHQVSTQMHTRL